MKYLSEFDALPESSPPYVAELVHERRQSLDILPAHLLDLLADASGPIVDVGPGEGVSTMALAGLNAKATILGIEMDRKHLQAAWPLCRKYPHVKLAWGAFGGPSNLHVDREVDAIPEASVQAGSCAVLFSWLGLSRQVIFTPRQLWSDMVRDSCILVYPAFWRIGFSSLPPSDLAAIDALCKRLDISRPVWSGTDAVPGFRCSRFYSTGTKASARGWILWLTGLFDPKGTFLWDTLADRRSAQPMFQLPNVAFELEVAHAWQ